MRLVPYDGTVPPLPAVRGWPHDDTAIGLSFAANGAWTWLIVDDDGRIAGECGVKGLPDPDGQVEIGYGLAGGSRGHGLGTAAVRELLDQLARRGVRTVVAEVGPDNLPSRRLLERCGFTVTAADDHAIWYRLDVASPSDLG